MILTHGANSISSGGSILPDGYQQLKYIHFQGNTNSRLYTVYAVTNNYSIELKGKVHSFTSDGGLLSIGGANCSIIAPSSSQYIKVRNTNLSHLGYQDTYDKSIMLDDFTMVLNKNQFKVNDESPIELWHYASNSGQLQISLTTASNNFDLYSIKFINTSDGTAAFHFIPCKELSTGNFGLYEIISQGFTLGTNVAP